jgi:hypothetical protein
MTEERRLETGRRGLAAIEIEGARLPEPVLALSGVEAAATN